MPKKKDHLWDAIERFKSKLVTVAGIMLAIGAIYGGINWALTYYTTSDLHDADMAVITNDLDILYNDFKNHKHEGR